MAKRTATFKPGPRGGRAPSLVSGNKRYVIDPKKKSRGVPKHIDSVSEDVRSLLAVKIEQMSALGINVQDIAKACGVSTRTLYKYYGESLDRGRIEANASVAAQLYKRCHANDKTAVTAQMFWLKTRGGWTEKAAEQVHKVEVTKVERVIVDPD